MPRDRTQCNNLWTGAQSGREEVGGLAVAGDADAADVEAGGGGRDSAFRRARPSPRAAII